MNKVNASITIGLSIAGCVAVSFVWLAAQPEVIAASRSIPTISAGSSRSERAGSWRLGHCEATALPTKVVKIVVTDDRGRYVLPDLSRGNYDVWVRGYGLVDSKR